MNKFSFILNFLVKSLCFFLIFISFFSFAPAVAQKKNPQKPATSQKKSQRVIYGIASFYANKFNGRRTASGEIFNQNKLTCACNMLPLGTWIKVTNIRNGKSVEVKVNDRLHPKMRRVADLSKAAAIKLGYTSQGLVRVKVAVIGKKKV
jgi:rare lipoprotein A